MSLETSFDAPRTLTFQHCWVNISPGFTETVYHDGSRVPATANDTDEYRANAIRYGYGEDRAALSREHEILHTFLLEKMTGGASPTLWAVAHGQTEEVAPLWQQEQEEVVVLGFQIYMNGGDPGDALAPLEERGLSLPALREEAFRLLRPGASVPGPEH